jgi:hypothetical protein
LHSNITNKILSDGKNKGLIDGSIQQINKNIIYQESIDAFIGKKERTQMTINRFFSNCI